MSQPHFSLALRRLRRRPRHAYASTTIQTCGRNTRRSLREILSSEPGRLFRTCGLTALCNWSDTQPTLVIVYTKWWEERDKAMPLAEALAEDLPTPMLCALHRQLFADRCARLQRNGIQRTRSFMRNCY